MNRNGYFAVVLYDTWTDVVRKNATMDVVRVDHITIAYKPDETTFENLRGIMGKRVNAYISELRRNENIEAFWVTDMFYDSYRLTEDEKRLTRVDDGAAHITISHKKGLKPKEANTMFTNPTHSEKRVGYVEGIFMWIDFNKKERI